MKIAINKLSLANQILEKYPENQKQSPLYKKVLKSIKEIGIINPLLVVQEKDQYKVVYGNNRYLAGLELGYEEFEVAVLPDALPKTIMDKAKEYQSINLD